MLRSTVDARASGEDARASGAKALASGAAASSLVNDRLDIKYGMRNRSYPSSMLSRSRET